jgi:hypothetical protein
VGCSPAKPPRAAESHTPVLVGDLSTRCIGGWSGRTRAPSRSSSRSAGGHVGLSTLTLKAPPSDETTHWASGASRGSSRGRAPPPAPSSPRREAAGRRWQVGKLEQLRQRRRAAGRSTSCASRPHTWVDARCPVPRVGRAHQLGELVHLAQQRVPHTELCEAAQQLKVDVFVVRLVAGRHPAGPVLARGSGRARGAGPRAAGPRRRPDELARSAPPLGERRQKV